MFSQPSTKLPMLSPSRLRLLRLDLGRGHREGLSAKSHQQHYRGDFLAYGLWHQFGAQKDPYSVDKAMAPDLVYKGIGKFVNRPTSTGGKKYDKFFLYVPAEVAKDSQFPFKAGEAVEVRIDIKNRRVLVESA